MDATADERLRAAVREYLEAVDRLAALRPLLLDARTAMPTSELLARAWLATAAVRAAIQGLRQTYAGDGATADGDDVAGTPSPAAEKLADSAPAPLNQWPLRSGQRV